jgi:hypothetical protein
VFCWDKAKAALMFHDDLDFLECEGRRAGHELFIERFGNCDPWNAVVTGSTDWLLPGNLIEVKSNFADEMINSYNWPTNYEGYTTI